MTAMGVDPIHSILRARPAAAVLPRRFFDALLYAALLLYAAPLWAAAPVRHELQVRIAPAEHHIEASDRITLPDDMPATVSFTLHAALQPTIDESEARLVPLDAVLGRAEIDMDPALQGGAAPVRHYRVTLPAGQRTFTVRYAGTVYHPVRALGEESARSFSVSPGLISEQGVLLAGSTAWYPVFGARLLDFDLAVVLPDGWRSVSQGQRSEQPGSAQGVRERWRIEQPQEEIYLVANRFTEYRQSAGAVQAQVFLREPDAALAQRYLDATVRYLKMYSDLLGAYPYRKFALVENFWETGYGMPSFTLLGPRVIRFPFILHSSYPHEILHNWWGNGVYVDYASGNWAEGLTSYLADHLIKELRGQGAEHRRAALQRYADYVRAKQDFALSEFRGRHNAVTEAVGYGKTMMLFHMLRQRMGDDRFVAALRRLYRDNAFRVAGFDDVRAAFAAQGATALDELFAQWVQRAGAPELRVHDARATPLPGGGFVLSATLSQVQPGPAYRLQLPVAVYLAGQDHAHQARVEMTAAEQRIELRLEHRPVRLDVDPEFDVFRRVHRNEIPPALSQAFGAEQALIVLPSAASTEMRAAYAQIAEAWGRDGVTVQQDSELDALPADRSVWLLGWENRFRPLLENALGDRAQFTGPSGLQAAGRKLDGSRDSVVLVTRLPDDPAHALAWAAVDQPQAAAGLARKLPHYGKYGYLAFRGPAPDNVLKGQWTVDDSPLSVAVLQADGAPVSPVPAKLAPRAPLAELPPAFSAERMLRDVRWLADPGLGGRALGSAQLDIVADYIAAALESAGLKPGGDEGGFLQRWQQDLGKPPRDMSLRNVVGVLPGSDPRLAAQAVVVGAHYDHLGTGWPDVHRGDEGKVHPGADDNASGVAVLLELARSLRGAGLARSVVFVAFTGEEAGRAGSRRYVQQFGEAAGARVMAMLNLDTVGRLGDRPLLVLGAGSAREWPHIFRGAGFVSGVRVQAVADEYGSSDQRSFLDAGIPAVQLFSGPHSDFHRPGDTADKVDGAGLVKVATVLNEAVRYLADRDTPLTAQPAAVAASAAARPARRAQLGTVPDFSYTGPGVRLEGVSADSPAARAGMRAGDVVIAIDEAPIADLRVYAEALRRHGPGDRITIRLRRGETEHTLEATLSAR